MYLEVIIQEVLSEKNYRNMYLRSTIIGKEKCVKFQSRYLWRDETRKHILYNYLVTLKTESFSDNSSIQAGLLILATRNASKRLIKTSAFPNSVYNRRALFIATGGEIYRIHRADLGKGVIICIFKRHTRGYQNSREITDRKIHTRNKRMISREMANANSISM